MSRKGIIGFFVVYFFVALAISALWELATPGIADIRPAAIVGQTIGRVVALFVLPGVLPLLYWAIRRFRSDSSLGVLSTWAMLGATILFLSGMESSHDGTLRPAQIPANVSEFFTNDYDTFIRVVRSGCVDSATKNQTRSGLTDRQISTYCQCVADNLLNQMTVAELKTSLYARTGRPASIQDKASKAGIQCQRPALGG